MHNKIKSFNLRGKRGQGRPFNTTTYPWRSTSIGKGFFLPVGINPSNRMTQVLRKEGFIYKKIDLSTASTTLFYMQRVA